MANMARGTKWLLSCFLVLFLFLQVFAEASVNNGMGIPAEKREMAAVAGIFRAPKIRPKINCNFACARRCLKASRTNVCTRACGTCCSKCQCVPAGTSGNTSSCPCYAGLRTHGKKPKCP